MSPPTSEHPDNIYTNHPAEQTLYLKTGSKKIQNRIKSTHAFVTMGKSSEMTKHMNNNLNKEIKTHTYTHTSCTLSGRSNGTPLTAQQKNELLI